MCCSTSMRFIGVVLILFLLLVKTNIFFRVQNIFPTPEKISVADSRMVKLLQFARKVEGTMYEQANSRVNLCFLVM